MSTDRHGTAAGHQRHLRAGERPCLPCTYAKRDYDAQRLAEPRFQAVNRARARAQSRAMTRLRQAHIDEYRAYYAEERETRRRDMGAWPK